MLELEYDLDLTRPVSKANLFTLLAKRGAPVVQTRNGKGILQAIARESGSGRCFNVEVLLCGGEYRRESFFVRTVD